jgi:hypothetical protein
MGELRPKEVDGDAVMVSDSPIAGQSKIEWPQVIYCGP